MNSLNRVWVMLSTWLVPPSKRDDKGATLIEYAAVVILIAGVVAAILAIGIPSRIGQSITTAITQILTPYE
ncbi:Flp family type IVb pilin [Nocardiopsis sp. CT-R113]|uniref:Flp family type IVb pilin n=1 Tax=Nocardiopsis codii TaxID=3065942 RepID=A0ABU7K0Q5_9ACTN|nr:Flp family type IVb pilin [Nocardiopsis sp. CT-R113]MEE2035833.1 Flp family type IVb pilin [Nocardiopsis sp. CT-R113]